MKKDFVCQLHFDHKIWSEVSVIITRRNVEYFLRSLACCFHEEANAIFNYNTPFLRKKECIPYPQILMQWEE
jgi:hypothetical protein